MIVKVEAGGENQKYLLLQVRSWASGSPDRRHLFLLLESKVLRLCFSVVCNNCLILHCKLLESFVCMHARAWVVFCLLWRSVGSNILPALHAV